jgi:hypothetical protein
MRNRAPAHGGIAIARSGLAELSLVECVHFLGYGVCRDVDAAVWVQGIILKQRRPGISPGLRSCAATGVHRAR